MAIYQVEDITGTNIVWAIGDPTSLICSLTSTSIDAEIQAKGIVSIMKVHKTLYNSWLTKCEIDTDLGGLAETIEQQAAITNGFIHLCLYAYLKQWCFNAVSSGCCKDDCYVQQKRMLKKLSEDIVCRAIPITCIKDLYLQWLHGTCDTVETKVSIVSLFSTITVEANDCHNHNHHHHYNHIQPPHLGGCISCGS